MPEEHQLRPFTYEPAYSSEIDFERSSKSSTGYKRYPAYSIHEWSLEALSSVVALGALAAIAAIFGYMDNKPYSDWTAPVSLNATISILTTACITLLMYGVSEFIGQLKWLHFKGRRHKLSHFEKYDDASRSVWGSIKFITTVKPNIATIGAFVTILRISFPAFTQQVVQLEQRNIITPDDNVTFGFAHEYSHDVRGQLANAGITGIPQDPNMQSAIVQGLYGIETPATFTCPGVCQWTGSYVSLGFSSSCNNVTQETLQTQLCNGTQSSNVCNMTTPGGLTITTRWGNTDWATNYFMNATSLLGDTSATRLDALPDITRFAVYRASPDGNFTVWNTNVTECVLALTAYEYTGAKANGSDFAFGTTREVDFGSGQRNIWNSGGYGPPLGWVYTNSTKDAGTDTDTEIPALNISHASLFAIENFFESDAIVTEWVAGNYPNNKFGLAAALSGDVDIDARFKKMAASMTDYVRRGPNARSAGGERLESQPFVSIRWRYFVAPIVTEVLGVVLAVMTIFSNRDVPLWKSSILAVLACRVDKGSGEVQTEVKDIKKIEEEAENVEVKLQ